MSLGIRFAYFEVNGMSRSTPLMKEAEELASELHSKTVRPAIYPYAMSMFIATPFRPRQMSGMAVYDDLETWFATQDGSKVPKVVWSAIVAAGGLIIGSAAMNAEVSKRLGDDAAVVHLADTLNHEAIHISIRKGKRGILVDEATDADLRWASRRGK